MKIIGLDIGGAYIKQAVVELENGGVVDIKTKTVYFPIWKEKNNLEKKLVEFATGADAVAVTTTADASDAYMTKKETVAQVLGAVERVFGPGVKVLTADAGLVPMASLMKNPISAASANWAATAGYVSRLSGNAVLIDIGSTTCDIIPIKNGKVAAKGKTDFERLAAGELVYTGALRTNAAAIVDCVPVGKKKVAVSSEYFANTADIYLILGKIAGEDYTCETPDGRGNDKKSAMVRVARVVCADAGQLGEKEINGICRFVAKSQEKRISAALEKVIEDSKLEKPDIYITGTGSFIAKNAAESIGLKCKELGFGNSATAICLALMVANKDECD